MKKVRVKDVASINALKFNFKGRIEVDYLDTGSLTENCFERTEKIILGKDILPSRAQRAVKDKTILYSTVRPRQHHFGIVEDTSENLVVSSGFVTIDADPESIDPFFLYYSITRPDKIEHICRIADSAVSSYPSINPDDIANLEIEIEESLDDQRKIASVLHDIELKMRSNTSVIAELESIAKDIYDYWFVQFDFPDENGKPYKSSGGKMVWNEELKREIPEGWKPAKLGDFVTIKRGISYSASNLVDDGFPMINLNSFTPSATYKTSGIKYYSGEIKESGQVNAYDLLMCTTQQTDIDGKTDIVGKTMLVPDLFNSKMVFSMDLVRIHTDELLKALIVSETKTPWYNKYITGFATGTSILHLKMDGFLSYQIPLPVDTAVMRRFNSMYMEWERKKSIAMKENEELTSLRDWLLPMLMNGQVKVGKKNFEYEQTAPYMMAAFTDGLHPNSIGEMINES